MMLGIKRTLTYCFVLIILAFLVPSNVHANQYNSTFPDIIICGRNDALATSTLYYSWDDIGELVLVVPTL